MPQEKLSDNIIQPKIEKINVGAEKKEKHAEKKAEKVEASLEKKPLDIKTIFPTKSKNDIIASSQARDHHKERALVIDKILSEGLDDVFLNMNKAKQEEFKKKGEETVREINKLLDKTKIKVSKVIKLIRSWLKVIPGVNKFFLEQESKIKTDKIIKVRNKF